MRSKMQPYVPMDYSGSYADICRLWNDTTASPPPQTIFGYKTTASSMTLSYNRSFSPLKINTGWGDILEVKSTTAVQVDHVLREPSPDREDDASLSEIHLRLWLDKDMMPSHRYRKAMLAYLQDMRRMITNYGITSLSDTYDVHRMPAEKRPHIIPSPAIMLPSLYTMPSQ